ncbi:MAG TPA: SAM-dependent methyltransferase, partial [Terriglobia bacterium]|nr:SAM-dependent methyltransferase [Terriglobia bacterium]
MGLTTPDVRQRSLFPLLLLLACGSGAAALIYEVVWFQVLELVIGSSAVSIAALLATFMGGTCLGSTIFPRLVSNRRDPLRVYAVIEIGIAALGILLLVLMPLVGGTYTSWSGYGLSGFLLRGMVAAACLLPPTLLMGATLPALARTLPPTSSVSRLGGLYAANILGAVFGCLLAGFYLLRQYDGSTATFIAAAMNLAVAGVALLPVESRPLPEALEQSAGNVQTERSRNRDVALAIALSGFCALAAETIWTRVLGLVFGGSV